MTILPVSASPFRTEGVVEPPYFTARADELDLIRTALEAPQGRMLVHGERRMGTSSVLHVARLQVERRGGHVVFADLSTASSAADMANRVLAAADRALGGSWPDLPAALAARPGVRLDPVADPVSGQRAILAVEAGLRSRPAPEQYDAFVSVLDALESEAARRDAGLGVVLDGFQRIPRSAGGDAEGRLPGAIRRHRRLSYVVAGPDASLGRRTTGPEGAFHELFRALHIGPIERSHLARWIDERMASSERPAPGLGRRAIQVAGDRTRDVVRVADAAWTVVGARGESGLDPGELVRRALERLVAEEDDRMRAVWSNLTELQQNVLRAVAWNEAGLTSQETVDRFGLGFGGTARNTALALEKQGLLRRPDDAPGFRFDSPFARAWVVRHALPDAGIRLPIDHY